MDKEHIIIETFGLSHFCIKNKNAIDAIKLEFEITGLSVNKIANEINWDFIYQGSDTSKKFMLLTDLNEWSYLIWKCWDFDINIELAKRLSNILHTNVNYYFVDSYTATSRWVFSENGIVTRAYFESHGTKLYDIGFNETEDVCRQIIKESFVEDVFWDLYDKTCQTLNDVNRQQRKEVTIYTGIFDDNNFHKDRI